MRMNVKYANMISKRVLVGFLAPGSDIISWSANFVNLEREMTGERENGEKDGGRQANHERASLIATGAKQMDVSLRNEMMDYIRVWDHSVGFVAEEMWA